MHLTRCPICHSRIHLEALVQDAAGRELLMLLTQLDTQTGAALVAYLGLFRSATRDLANDRALRLATETLDLCPPADRPRISVALAETVEAFRSKQPHRPLKNHNYLVAVLKSIEMPPVAAHAEETTILPKSKTGQAYLALERLKGR